MIAVVDYGMGNVRSVLNALEHIGADARLASEAAEVRGAERLIIPGVGAFGDAMASLRERDLADAVREVAADGRPVLGLCLGMQLLATRSLEHGEHQGLDLIPGTVERIPAADGLRVPHVGWNSMTVAKPTPLTAELSDESTFYFVHSFHFVPDVADHVGGTTDHGRPLVTYVHAGNVHGVQFHPEKSQRDGLAMLTAFAGLPC